MFLTANQSPYNLGYNVKYGCPSPRNSVYVFVTVSSRTPCMYNLPTVGSNFHLPPSQFNMKLKQVECNIRHYACYLYVPHNKCYSRSADHTQLVQLVFKPNVRFSRPVTYRYITGIYQNRFILEQSPVNVEIADYWVGQQRNRLAEMYRDIVDVCVIVAD